MQTYVPASLTPVVADFGTWVATGRPDVTVTVTIDPRVISWLVKQAAKRTPQTYQTFRIRIDLS